MAIITTEEQRGTGAGNTPALEDFPLLDALPNNRTSDQAEVPLKRVRLGWKVRLLRGLTLAIALAAVLVGTYIFIIRPWHMRWGATDAELAATLPGDELVTSALSDSQTTRAITVDAPAESIWPWLVQWGQGKGGWYSYEMLENLLGCNMTNADRIHPEWQNTKVGDYVRMYPEGSGPPPYRVAAMVSNRAFVIGHPIGDLDAPMTAQTEWNDTWTFALQPVDDKTTRLIIRARWSADGELSGDSPIMRMIEPGTFIMERGSLWGVKERAERAAGLPANHTAAEGWGIGFMLVALAALVAILFSSKWPFKAVAIVVVGAAWWLVLFFGHPSPYLAFLVAVAAVGSAVWAFWPSSGVMTRTHLINARRRMPRQASLTKPRKLQA